MDILALLCSWVALEGLTQPRMSSAFRCDALDTPHDYITTKKIRTKTGDLQRAQKDRFELKRGLLGPWATPKRPITKSKCIATVTPIQTDPLAVLGTKYSPLGLPQDLQRGQKGCFGLKWALLGALGVP